MARSHPPSLLRHVRTTLQQECGVGPGSAIAVAVSGGPDSMALLHALSLVSDEMSLRIVALTVDHGLRVEAAEEAEIVRRFCHAIGVGCHVVALGLKDGPNLQERARAARYNALWDSVDEYLGGEGLLATGHHKDDRAETVLLRLLRGSSLEGLGVLPARTDRLIRPMIRAGRIDVEAHVARHALDVARDPSNDSARFSRVRVRHELLPLMRDLGEGVVDHLVAIADEACGLDEPLGLSREQRRQLRRALREPGFSPDVRLPGGLRLIRRRNG